VAQTLDVPGKVVAKVVMVQADGYFVMAVLPSTWRVDLSDCGMSSTPATCGGNGSGDRKSFPRLPSGRDATFGNLYGMECTSTNYWQKTSLL